MPLINRREIKINIPESLKKSFVDWFSLKFGIVKSYNKRIILRLIFQSLRYNFINITPWLAFILLMFPSEYNKKFIQFLKKNKNDK